MPNLPMGIHAYKRNATGEPEIKLVNRFVEKNPANVDGKIALVSRPGTKLLGTFPADTAGGGIRGLYTNQGLFNNNLFVVSGTNFYRYNQAVPETIHIIGTIRGSGRPSVTWDQGIGYQRLFIADSQLLNYYDGGSKATGTLTASGTPDTTDVIEIAGIYYSWNSDVEYGSPDGTATQPWLANLTSDPLQAMADLINFVGTPGIDFSSAIGGANTLVTAAVAGGPPATTLTLTSRSDTTSGAEISTSVYAGTHTSWGGATLSGGGSQSISGILVPDGDSISVVENLKSFILCAVTDTNKFYYVRPGATTIDALDFATKEANPDPIVDIKTVGDVCAIIGTQSVEWWYATGDNNNPLAPIEGRTIGRGAQQGMVAIVEDSIVLVGSDGKVYNLGGSSGAAAGQVGPVSDNAIEERIRIQLRREAGLTT